MESTTAERLKMIMRERRLTQKDIIDLAEPYCEQYHLKLTKSDMSQFVNGKVKPGQWKISLLSHALNVSEAWLMGYDVPQERKKTPADSAADAMLMTADEQVRTIIELLIALPDHKKQEAIRYIRYLADSPDT